MFKPSHQDNKSFTTRLLAFWVKKSFPFDTEINKDKGIFTFLLPMTACGKSYSVGLRFHAAPDYL